MIRSSVQIVGLQDLQARTAAMAKKMTPADLRRPGLSVIQSTVISNRQRLDRGGDVNGVSMQPTRPGDLRLPAPRGSLAPPQGAGPRGGPAAGGGKRTLPPPAAGKGRAGPPAALFDIHRRSS